jgi:hypothetical protein
MPKAFKFTESFSKLKKLSWSPFKSSRRCAAGFSKENCTSETNFVGLKNSEFSPGQYFNSLVLKSLSEFKSLWHLMTKNLSMQ